MLSALVSVRSPITLLLVLLILGLFGLAFWVLEMEGSPEEIQAKFDIIKPILGMLCLVTFFVIVAMLAWITDK